MFNTGLFNSEDTKLDYVLKISTLCTVLCLFFDSFFGYWISLDRQEFGDKTSSWSGFTAAVIIFYISIEILTFITFVAMCRQYPLILIGTGLGSFLLFILGLFQMGLRINFFCFILLFLATFQFPMLGIYFHTIEKCQLRQHGFDCRGRCLRQEYLQQFDDRLLGGRLRTNFGIGVPGRAGEPETQHTQFHNPVEQPEPPPPSKPPRSEDQQSQNSPITNQETPMTAVNTVTGNENSAMSIDLLGSSHRSLRRQNSQSSTDQHQQQSSPTPQLLDPASFLQQWP